MPMLPAPRASLAPNSAEFEALPLVKPTGFREYDARWWFGIPGAEKPPELNLLGVQALGLGLGTLIHEFGVAPRIVVGHDFRFYSQSIKQALTLGLLQAGMEVNDIGLALSPTAYFAQFALDIPCVAMVTASHNENGWTGVKMGANKPLTFGPDEMGALKKIVLAGAFKERPGGALKRIDGMRERYIADVASRVKLSRPSAKKRSRPASRSTPLATPIAVTQSSTSSSLRMARTAVIWPWPPSMRMTSGQAGKAPSSTASALLSGLPSSFSSRENRRVITSRITPKSSPGVRFSDRMLNLRY